jgi:hypothetical protein
MEGNDFYFLLLLLLVPVIIDLCLFVFNYYNFPITKKCIYFIIAIFGIIYNIIVFIYNNIYYILSFIIIIAILYFIFNYNVFISSPFQLIIRFFAFIFNPILALIQASANVYINIIQFRVLFYNNGKILYENVFKIFVDIFFYILGFFNYLTMQLVYLGSDDLL